MSTIAIMGLGGGVETTHNGPKSATAGRAVGFPGTDAEAQRLRREWLLAMGLSAEEAARLSQSAVPALNLSDEKAELEAANRLNQTRVSYASLKVMIRRRKHS